MRLIWTLTLLIAALLGALMPLAAKAAWPTVTVPAMIDAPLGPDDTRLALAAHALGMLQGPAGEEPEPAAGAWPHGLDTAESRRHR